MVMKELLNKKYVSLFAVLIAVIILAVFLRGQQDVDMFYCTTDEDCAIVPVGCCRQSNTVINKNYVEFYEKARLPGCKNAVCPAVEPSPEQVDIMAKCKNNRCEVRTFNY